MNASRRSRSQRGRQTRLWTLACVAGLTLIGGRTGNTQFADAEPEAAAAAAEAVSPGAEAAPHMGALDLDRSVIRLLGQADELAEAGRYTDALVIWQRVLDDAHGWLVTHDALAVTTFGGAEYKVYRPVHAEVERRITALPAEVLELYRRDVDGAAAALHASRTDPASLPDVVRRYLLSSSGRAAAFTLAGYHLDRGEFARAARVLERLHTAARETSRSGAADLLPRLAIAEAALGDLESARRRLDELRLLSGTAGRESVARALDRARQFVDAAERERAADQRGAAGFPPDASRPIPLASALPEESHIARLTEAWSRSMTPIIREGGAADPGDRHERESGIRGTVVTIEDPSAPSDGQAPLVEPWTQSNWMPAGDVLVEGDLAYFKGSERLIAVEAATGDVRWLGVRNRFELTWSSQAFGQAGAKAAARIRPSSPEEIQRFGDRIHHSLALIDGTVYSLEGRPLDLDSDESLRVGAAEASRAIVRRSPANCLAAYDARSGKLKWRRAPVADGEAEAGGAADRGFLAAPVALRDRLLAPVSHQGELWLYALDARSGDVLWNVFLCDEPIGGCSPWAPVGLAVDGGEVYVASGAGIVFAVDVLTGRVEWAVQYRRNGTRETQATRPGAGFVVSPELDGWARDVVLVHGPRLIVTPSDYGYVIALDRRDGRLLWHSPRQPSEEESPADICLGIAGDGLFVAGRNVVRRYDLPSGRLVWDTPTGDSYGRGLLTSAALYVPVGSAILRLDLESGSELSRSELITASREPVGNLATDGDRLLCLAGERLYALAALETHLERLANRIEAGDADAQVERMRLRLRLGELDEAITDLRAACELIRNQQGPAAAARRLLNGLLELNLADERPQVVLELIAWAGVVDSDDAQRMEAGRPGTTAAAADSAWKRTQLLHAALRQISDSTADGRARAGARGPASVQAILDAAPLYQPAYLQMAARRAVAAAASTEERDLLISAAQAEDPAVRSLALSGIDAVLEHDAVPLLQAALDDQDETVRFEAAVALLNRGERGSLPALATLLDSADLNMRNRSLATLRAATGQHFGFVASSADDERAEKAAAWQTWAAEHGGSAELRLPVRETGLMLGRTLISYTNNRVIELDDSGRAVWQLEVANPWGCEGLPNGHRLVASYSGRAVFEYDAEGNIVWQKSGLPSSPYSVQRLDSGNTLVSCYGANKILEFTPDGSLAHEIPLPDHPRDARRLDNGRTLVALYTSGRVVEVDPDGKLVWEVGGMNKPVAAQRLDNGHTLVCQYSGKQVVEIDRDGQTVWFKGGLEYPYDAQRLPTGNTLIVDRNGVQEVDPGGTVVWEQPGNGATSVCRY